MPKSLEVCASISVVVCYKFVWLRLGNMILSLDVGKNKQNVVIRLSCDWKCR